MSMEKVVIIGDDLTGSNATGALYAGLGLSAVTVQAPVQPKNLQLNTDVLVVNTNSRHLPAADAAAAVADTIRVLPQLPTLIAKRIDTTLRGNVGSEIEALLTAVRARRDGVRVTAVMVPAFPASGRTTVGGIQLVDGEPVARTWAGSDPFTPVRHSSVASVVGAQTDLTVGHLGIDSQALPIDARVAEMTALASNYDVVVVDAVSQNDLLVAAETLVAAKSPLLDFVVVDTGPFGAAVCKSCSIRPTGEGTGQGPLFALIGSLTTITDEQTKHLQRTQNASIIEFSPLAGNVDRLIEELVEAVDQGAEIIGVKTQPSADEVVSSDSSSRVMEVLGSIAVKVVGRLRPRGIYATGGDVCMAVLDALGADGFKIEEEVVPLAVAGILVGGEYGGLPFATKGGLIGNSEAAAACIEALAHLSRRNPYVYEARMG